MTLYNLVKVNTNTTGSGTISLGTAFTGFLSFKDAQVVDGTVSYGILDRQNSEVGRGTYSSSGSTLARTSVLKSTNSGSAINLSGSAIAYITALAEDFDFSNAYLKLDASNDPLTGDLSFLNAGISTASYVNFNNSYTVTGSEPIGSTFYDWPNHTISTVLENGIVLQHGQEFHVYGKNISGSTIHDGDAVSIIRANGQWTAFGLTSASDVGSAYAFSGLATQVMADNDFGYVTMMGEVREIDTSHLTEGKAVYVNPSVRGHLTSTFPSVPNYIINAGVCERSDANHGRINVIRSVVPKMADLSDVDGTPLNTPGQILVWNNSGSYFDANYNITNYVPTSRSISTTSPLLINSGSYANLSGSVLFSFGTQSASKVLAGPSSGVDANPSFRYLVSADLPNHIHVGTGTGGTTQLPIDVNRFGFMNQTETGMSFDGSSVFTLSDSGSGWSYYRNGIKYTVSGSGTVTAGSPMVNNSLYFIYIDSLDGSLSSSTSPWTLNDNKCPVSTIYWDSTLTPKYVMTEERHTCLIDRRSHYYEHFLDGTRMQTTGSLTGPTVSGTTDASKTVGIASSILIDEDIIVNINDLARPNGTTTIYFVLYRSNSTTWKWKASNMPFAYNTNNTNNIIQYDSNGTMIDGTIGSGGSRRWQNSYICFSNIDGVARQFIIPGRAEFTTLVLAQAEDPSTFAFPNFITAEFYIAYRLTWLPTTAASSGTCVLAASPTLVKVAAIQTSATAGSIIHNALSGLDGGTIGEYYHLTSAEYTGTGTGSFVRYTSASLVTPNIGVASATSINGNIFTSGSGTLSLNGYTLNVPYSGSAAMLNVANNFTENQTIDHKNLILTQVAPPPAPVASLNTTSGSLNGTYYYTISYVTSDGETDTSLESDSIVVINQKTDLTFATSSDSKVNARKIYRNSGSGFHRDIYLIATIPNNTDTAYTDNIPDSSLVTLAPRQNTTGARIFNGTNRIIDIDFSTVAIGMGALTNGTGYANTAVGATSLGTNTSGGYNTAFGINSLLNNTVGSYNTAVGVDALAYNVSGRDNVAVGLQTLLQSIGSENVGIGSLALAATTSGCQNLALGSYALNSNILGNANTAIGGRALKYVEATGNVGIGTNAIYNNLTGGFNVAIGYNSSYGTSGSSYTNNVFIGAYSGFGISTGANNVGIGASALSGSLTANGVVAIGYESLKVLTGGFANTAIGYQTLKSVTTSNYSTAIGYQTLTSDIGGYNTGIGYNVMFKNTNGTNNIGIGHQALYNNIGGGFNVGIGVLALFTGSAIHNNVAIGFLAGRYETNDNKLFIDSLDRTNEDGGRTKSLIYGIFNSTVANQSLYFNSGSTTFSGSIVSTGYIQSNGRKKEVVVTAIDYTANSNDEVIVGTANLTTTLPSATGSGQTYRIICRSGNTTIEGNASDLVKGQLNQKLIAGEDLIITDTGSGIWE